MYELNIKSHDWFLILLTGVLFSSLLTMLGYTLLDESYLQGLFFGAVIGFCITLFSLILITFMNTKILPSIAKKYWNPIAAIFSFLSGYLGFLSGLFFSKLLNITILHIFYTKLSVIALTIGLLTYIMGVIIYSFVMMRNQKEKRDLEFIESRLKSLETQLNPHFIFNALNSIAELIHHDKEKAEDAIIIMSSFLRNSMNERALLTLESEIKNVTSYVKLENIRFSNNILLDIEENIPAWSVPKFSLQLLVENAIKHGYRATTLHIEIKFDRGKRRVIISNDGKEMRENAAFGVGLNNLEQRLKLLCAGDIQVSNTAKSEFTITLGECNENFNR